MFVLCSFVSLFMYVFTFVLVRRCKRAVEGKRVRVSSCCLSEHRWGGVQLKMSHLTGDCRCPINPLALSPPPECLHWSGVAQTNLKRGLRLLMPISPSLSAHSFQSLHAPRPTLLACVSSVCPASYSSSLPFMIYKGQPSKGSLSTLPLN